MAKKEITSRPGFFGTVNHYDSNGRKVGESRPGFFGTTNHYDAKGHKVGSSMTGSFGNTTHWDTKGHRVGTSQSGVFPHTTTIPAAAALVRLSLVSSEVKRPAGMIKEDECARSE